MNLEFELRMKTNENKIEVSFELNKSFLGELSFELTKSLKSVFGTKDKKMR